MTSDNQREASNRDPESIRYVCNIYFTSRFRQFGAPEQQPPERLIVGQYLKSAMIDLGHLINRPVFSTPKKEEALEIFNESIAGITDYGNHRANEKRQKGSLKLAD